MKRTLLLAILFFIVNFKAYSAADAIQYTPVNDTIKFTLSEHNNILVEATLNTTTLLKLMFHTAIGSVSLTPEMTAKLKTENQKSSNSKSWTGAKEVNYIENNSLTIANLSWDSLAVWLDMLSGPGSDGKFGPNLFGNKIIEINNDEQIIVLHDPEKFNPDEDQIQKFKLTTDEHNSIFISGEVEVNGQHIAHQFLLHSGYGGTVILDDSFCKENPVFSELETIEVKELKDSFGNIIKTKKVMVDNFKVGNTSFPKMPLSYFDSEIEIQNTSVMGGEILKRFNIYLDFEKFDIYLSRNKGTEAVFKS
ncbi:hypothetical protein [Portibacter lacus]|uniref:Clan AA aspartic protease n=1 Tax=Portibacter lacus TaxID=1099794 RepID=A0AA37SMB8_9BACT|nr:hypothetical protein [Portibacter lacus]GLR16024.1 hypothetical protein GCM10007940_06390 [Portibacter lacus]